VISPAHNIAIFLPLLVAVATISCTIAIHAMAAMAMVTFVRRERRLGYAGVSFLTDFAISAGVTLLALAAHLAEITVWALVFV
jgi:hypothetical protein